MTIIILFLSILGVIVFEICFKLLTKLLNVHASKAQWCGYFWLMLLVLCGIYLIRPVSVRTVAVWLPLLLTAAIHLSFTEQASAMDESLQDYHANPSGPNSDSGYDPKGCSRKSTKKL